jgi:polyribonucleotide nucleotidyltransferase
MEDVFFHSRPTSTNEKETPKEREVPLSSEPTIFRCELGGGKDIIFETGEVAKQAGGSVLARSGDTVVLCAATGAKKAKPGMDFFPLTVEYKEMPYSAGKIPGGFFKRKGRPHSNEILTCRCIDRPIRPLFPEGFTNEVQVFAYVVSFDPEHQPDTLAGCGASAALHISNLPFDGPTAHVRVGLIDGNYVLNPTAEEAENKSKLDLLIAGKSDAVMMIEAGANEVSEEEVLKGIEFGHQAIKKICATIAEMKAAVGKEVMDFTTTAPPKELVEEFITTYGPAVLEATRIGKKEETYEKISEIKAQVKAECAERVANGEIVESHVSSAYKGVLEWSFYKMVIEEDRRPDGRKMDEIRPIWSKVSYLPRTHGSCVFTRGETQAMTIATLGISEDQQIIDGLVESYREPFMLHYNFPPFSVGETRRVGGTSRRETGHGDLARRALKPMLPDRNKFPYTIQVTTEITESNGSSSMATVCSGSMALMDAGVPFAKPVAGIAMGLVLKDGKHYVLSDIQGWEDHYGEMDFKVAGTEDGINALQMDIKVGGVSLEILKEALAQARVGRKHILGEMAKTLAKPRDELSAFAPRILSIPIKNEKIGAVIGPGGKVIRHITESCGVKMEIDDVANLVHIISTDPKGAGKAEAMVKALIEEPEVGRIYQGRVVRIVKFGAFVEILPGKDGLVHISQLAEERVNQVEDIVKMGDHVPVKITAVDNQGRVSLSLKDARADLASKAESAN